MYAGWIEAESGSDDLNKKAIWAVGSKEGIEAFYNPYTIQNQDGNSGTGSDMLDSTDLAPVTGTAISDSADNSADNTDEVADTISESGTFKDIISGGTALKA